MRGLARGRRETRALDPIAQMTVREKIGQMQHPTFVPRADGTIPNYLETWTVEENIGFCAGARAA